MSKLSIAALMVAAAALSACSSSKSNRNNDVADSSGVVVGGVDGGTTTGGTDTGTTGGTDTGTTGGTDTGTTGGTDTGTTGGTDTGTTGGTDTTDGSAIVPLPNDATGATDGIEASTLDGLPTMLSDLQTAIDGGTISAPEALPKNADANGKFNGYVGFNSVTAGADAGQRVIGNLTIDADFDEGTVATTASDFSEFTFDSDGKASKVEAASGSAVVIDGTLRGEGNIARTVVSSTLVGDLELEGNATAAVNAALDGKVLDNGDSLVLSGGLSGDVGPGTDNIADGNFVASAPKE